MAKVLRKIGLENVQFTAPIGFYEEERVLKNKFIVNVWAEMPVSLVESDADELTNTVNYVGLYEICQAAFAKERRLLEPVAQEILVNILAHYSFIESASVKIQKLHPPIQAEIETSFVELNYSK